jgi:hypothetical protein
MQKGFGILVDFLTPKGRTGPVALAAMMLISCGCYCPRPHNFVDDTQPRDQSIGSNIGRAWAHDHTLIIEVHQTAGYNIAAFQKYVVDGALYLTSRRISSGGGGTMKFEIDVSKYHLREPWTENIYWLTGGGGCYPFGNPGFWSSAYRDPFTRKRIDLVNAE